MSSENLTQIAYRLIHDELMQSKIVPGDSVSEISLAQRFGVGRAPIRDAIKALQQEGLFVSLRRKGTFVPKLKPDEFRQLFEMREALESQSAYLAAKRYSGDNIVVLESLCDEFKAYVSELKETKSYSLPREKLDRYWILDEKFHRAVDEQSGNTQIKNQLAAIRTRQRVFTQLLFSFTDAFLSQSLSIHLWILRSLKEREPDNARQWASKHVRTECRFVLETMNTH